MQNFVADSHTVCAYEGGSKAERRWGPAPLVRGRGWPHGNTLLHHVLSCHISSL